MTKQSKLQLDSLLRLEQIMNRVEAAMKSMDVSSITSFLYIL